MSIARVLAWLQVGRHSLAGEDTGQSGGLHFQVQQSNRNAFWLPGNEITEELLPIARLLHDLQIPSTGLLWNDVDCYCNVVVKESTWLYIPQ